MDFLIQKILMVMLMTYKDRKKALIRNAVFVLVSQAMQSSCRAAIYVCAWLVARTYKNQNKTYALFVEEQLAHWYRSKEKFESD